MGAAVKLLEIGDAGVIAIDRLAIDHGRGRRQTGGSGRDQRIAIGPIVAAAREQPHAVALLANDQPVAIVLDFVNPLRADRRL